MKKTHSYATDIIEPITPEEVLRIVDRSVFWTLKILGINHLVSHSVEQGERPGVCKNIRLTITEGAD